MMSAITSLNFVELSLIVPMRNEQPVCQEFFERVEPILSQAVSSYEIICIDDGSTDGTVEAVTAARAKNPNIKLVSFSRNFGKEAALTAGIDLSSGQCVVPIDADLQDPPELIVDMLAAWRDGAQVVLARRSDRTSDSWLKRITARGFYKLFSGLAKPAIPADVGDFRLMDRVVVEALKRLPERSRFMKGLFAWVGYRQVSIDYVRPARASGTTNFNWTRLWNFALDGIISFSSLPLKVWSYFGLAVSFIALLYMVAIITRTLIYGIDVPGYASTMSIIMFFNGIILITLGAIGEYLARIFIEVKQRPIYLIQDIVGFETSNPANTFVDMNASTTSPD